MPVKPKTRPHKAAAEPSLLSTLAGDGEVRPCPECGRDVRCYNLKGKLVVPQHDDPKTHEACTGAADELPA